MPVVCLTYHSVGIGLLYPLLGYPLGYLPHSGIKPTSLMFQALAGVFFTTSATWEAHCNDFKHKIFETKSSLQLSLLLLTS